jgi:hypothetical protein
MPYSGVERPHEASVSCTTDDLLPKFFATPNNDAEKRKEEARESEASSSGSVGQERTHIKPVNAMTLVIK